MEKVILAIDDDESFLLTIKDILEQEGYDVKTLSDSLETEIYIEKYKPGLIIMDIFMPDRSGFNLIESFNEKGIYQDIPKIFITCLDDDIERMTARACGVAHYITKPFQAEELISLVKKTLDTKDKGDERCTKAGK